jgi:hypothetical protein
LQHRGRARDLQAAQAAAHGRRSIVHPGLLTDVRSHKRRADPGDPVGAAPGAAGLHPMMAEPGFPIRCPRHRLRPCASRGKHRPIVKNFLI